MVENTHRITPPPHTFKELETRTYKEPNWYFLRVNTKQYYKIRLL